MMVARIEGPRKLQEICKGLMGDSAVDAVNGNVRNKRELWIEETLLRSSQQRQVPILNVVSFRNNGVASLVI